jgi:acyl carrier protein
VPHDPLTTNLIDYIRQTFLDGDPADELTDETPLLAWGVLDSFKTARLLTYIEEQLGTRVPPSALYADNFQDVRSIAALVRDNGGGAGTVRVDGASA